jgi:hypothetical protein
MAVDDQILVKKKFLVIIGTAQAMKHALLLKNEVPLRLTSKV